jgi:hypothetical protein
LKINGSISEISFILDTVVRTCFRSRANQLFGLGSLFRAETGVAQRLSRHRNSAIVILLDVRVYSVSRLFGSGVNWNPSEGRVRAGQDFTLIDVGSVPSIVPMQKN